MLSRSQLIRTLRPLARKSDLALKIFKKADVQLSMLHHDLAARFPRLIKPSPRQVTIAITAQCNLLCKGCRYGRDFMVGSRLPLELVRQALSDASEAGVSTARFFGGEPLLHPDLPAMIAHARSLGMEAYITTNGTLLARRFRELYGAGLQWMTIGFYGTGKDYDEYTGRAGQFAALEEGLRTVREVAGQEFPIQINYLLSRTSCSLEDLRATWDFARAHGCFFNVDPISETIPFFTDPSETDLDFRERDREALLEVVAELIDLKRAHESSMPQSMETLRALPDLLLRTKETRVPCDAYQLIWIGANGVVKLCDSHFDLGNLHERSLSEILFGKEHAQACRDGFQLKCPGCHCKIDSRIRKHRASQRRYRSEASPSGS